MQKNILVIGATGIAGSAFIRHCLETQGLLEDEKWQITGITRNPNTTSQHHRINYVQADLLGDCAALQQLENITHLVFAGYIPETDPALQLDLNAALLRNSLDALAHCPVEQVVLLQGMKYYGSHKGRFRTPAKEDNPRLDEPHYYYTQQDIIEASGIDWTCLRPHVICGTDSIGTPQNILSVIGCYASLCKARQQPLEWPGSEASYHALNQATDSSLLSQAIVWALQAPTARREAFNVTNGDFFRWQHLWPRIAEQFNMITGDCRPQALEQSMRGTDEIWQKLVSHHNLQHLSLSDICDWTFADYILKTEWDVMASTIKIREAGFASCMDTEAMYLRLLNQMQVLRVIP